MTRRRPVSAITTGAARVGGLLVAGGLVLGLAACSAGGSADSGSGEAGAADYGDITVQLSWLKNHEFSGYFEADSRGYFEDAGFGDVELVAGGMGGASAATALTSGTAWIGIGAPADIAQANDEGADLRIVATTYQKNPFTLVSADSDPITEPADLVGKTIAIADSSATNWEAFLAANDIDPSDVNRVPYGDAQTDLTLGQIDGFMGYGDGGAPLRASGFGAQEFLLADYGLSYSGEAVVVTAETLADEPVKVEAFLTAYAQGWKAAFDDVDGTIDLVVNDYGKDQNYDPAEIELSWEQQAKLILTDESREDGIGTISEAAVERNIESLSLVGFDVDEDDLFDTSLIAAVYEEHPDLILGESGE